MAEFDDKLNALLSNPDSMAQIRQLAQNLSGSMGGGAPSSPPPQPQPQPQPKPPAGGDLFSALAGGLDPAMLTRLLHLVGELGSSQASQARQLLYALRPYLQPQRQEKVERALQLARLIHVGKKFLAGWEG